jgi:hypothetical protein
MSNPRQTRGNRLGTVLGIVMVGSFFTLLYGPIIYFEVAVHAGGLSEAEAGSRLEVTYLPADMNHGPTGGGPNRFAYLPVGWGYKWVVCENTPTGPEYCWKK